ncbi:ISAs1 family transposase [Waterburya agarophytonicola]|uniref:ISAs1 family transposase n=1 Tax=Waterburya agarophytonicola TaxID=2886916 RepID=UPI0034E2CF4F
MQGLASRHNWVAMEQYGHSKQEWLKQFLELPNGIPSHDTIARVFARIDPLEFEQCFRSWIKEIAQLIQDQGADYCLALKGNHQYLHERVIQLFERGEAIDWSGVEYDFHRTINKGHGRTEIRRYWTMPVTELFFDPDQWVGLQQLDWSWRGNPADPRAIRSLET